MMKVLSTSLICLTATAALAQQEVQNNKITTSVPTEIVKQETSRSYKGTLEVSLFGRNFDDEIVNARFARSTILLRVTANFQDWLTGKLNAGQNFTSGASSNLYTVTEGGSGPSSSFLEEASLTAKAYDTVSLTAGILDTGLNPVSSVMSGGSWMAGRLETEIKGDIGSIGVSGLQGVPTGGGTSNRIVDEDTMPLYTTGTLEGKLTPGGGLEFAAAASHFVFTDLMSSTAIDSRKTGSSTVGESQTVFQYEYRGMEYAGKVEKKFDDGDKLTVRASTLTNEMAPTGQNRGDQVRVDYELSMNKWILKTGIAQFRIESDSIPAAYAPSGYGFTNREGTSVGVKFENKKERFALTGGYTIARVLDPDAQAAREFQADRQIYSIGAELKHDLF